MMKTNQEALASYTELFGESTQEVKDLISLFAINEFSNIDELLENHLNENQESK